MKKLWSLKEKGKLCDAFILVGGERINCHRNVLAVSSDYFDKSFEYSKDPVFSTLNIDSNALNYRFSPIAVEAILHSIYLGSLPEDLDIGLLPEILVIADMWILEALEEECVNMLKKNLTKENCVECLHLSLKLNLCEFKSNVIDFIRYNMRELHQEEDFSEIPEEELINVIDHPLVFSDEDWLWIKAIESWGDGDQNKMLKVLNKINYRHLIEINNLAKQEKAITKVKIDCKDENIKEIIAAKLYEKNDHFEGGFKYYPKSRLVQVDKKKFAFSFSPGCLVYYGTDRVYCKNVEMSNSLLDTFSISDDLELCQVVFKTDIFFIFKTGYGGYGASYEEDFLFQSLFVYSLTQKTLKRIRIPFSNILPNFNQELYECLKCYVCSSSVRLYLEGSSLYYMMYGDNFILLKMDLDTQNMKWELLAFHKKIQYRSCLFKVRGMEENVYTILKVDEPNMILNFDEYSIISLNFIKMSFTYIHADWVDCEKFIPMSSNKFASVHDNEAYHESDSECEYKSRIGVYCFETSLKFKMISEFNLDELDYTTPQILEVVNDILYIQNFHYNWGGKYKWNGTAYCMKTGSINNLTMGYSKAIGETTTEMVPFYFYDRGYDISNHIIN